MYHPASAAVKRPSVRSGRAPCAVRRRRCPTPFGAQCPSEPSARRRCPTPVDAQCPSTPSARRRCPTAVGAQCREAAEPRTPDAAKRPRPAAKRPSLAHRRGAGRPKLAANRPEQRGRSEAAEARTAARGEAAEARTPTRGRPKRGQPPASYASPRCYPLRVADPPPDSRPGAVTSEASDLGHASRARCRLGLRVEAPAAGVASTNRGRGRHGEDAREGPRPPTTMAAAMEAAYQHPQEYLAGETGSGGRQGGSGRGRPGGIGPNPRRAALARLWRVPRVRPNTQPALAEHAQGAAEHAAGVGPNVRRARARGTRPAYARGP